MRLPALSLLLTTALAYEPIPIPSTCVSPGYFDISSLSCNACPLDQVPDVSGYACQCDAGVITPTATTGYSCVACSTSGTAPTRDGTACLPCRAFSTAVVVAVVDNVTNQTTAYATETVELEGGTLGLDAATGDCLCADGKALIEYDGAGSLLAEKQCLACPSTDFVNGDGECEACPAEYMIAELVATPSGSQMECRCQDGYEIKTLVGTGWWGVTSACLETLAYDEVRSQDTASADTVDFLDLVGGGSRSVESLIFDQQLMPSAVECLRAVQAPDAQPRSAPSLLAGNVACQAIGNLCVMAMYDDDSAACALYRELQENAQATVNGDDEWKARLPGLYYEQGSTMYTQNDVPLTVSLDGDATDIGAVLKYMVASYSLNGTYLGLAELSDELQLCTGVARDATAYLTFGTGMTVDCVVKLDELLATTEPTFYDLYLQVDGGQLYPVPVKVDNLRVNGRKVNQNANSVTSQQNDQLVRRFFAVDAAAGLEAGNVLPTAVRYAKSARLRVTIILHTPTRIYPPLLELEYGEVEISSAAETAAAAEAALSSDVRAALTSSFVAKYTMEMGATWSTITILFVIAIVLWVLGWFFQLYLWMRRNQRQVIDGAFLVRAASQLARVFADVFFWLLFGTCGWLYCLFKNQDDVFVMMPMDDELGPFQTVLVICFAAKLLHVLDMIVQQASHDVFFVDWEQPQGAVPDAPEKSRDDDDERDRDRRKARRGGRGDDGRGRDRDRDRDRDERRGDRDRDRDRDRRDSDEDEEAALKRAGGAVSVWRSVFVANEWVRLQTQRCVSLEFNLLFLLFLLRGLDQELFATEIPNQIGFPGVTPDPLLRFALSSFMLLTLSLGQWLFRWAIWDRFFEDRVWQFVDLLAVTNISCFLMEEKFFGHYLHGRSVHAHADTDMLELNKNLKREQDELCPKRGLQKDSEIQTFQVYLSRGIREQYDSVYEGGASRLPETKRATDQKGRPRGFRAGPDRALKRHREVNELLVGFVSESLEQHRLDIRPKSYLEKLLGVPPEMAFNTRTSIFLEDPAGRFKQLLLYGREYDLVLLHVLTYGMFDMVFMDTFVALFATYIVDLIVRFVRREVAKKNIASKTLMDDRLLL